MNANLIRISLALGSIRSSQYTNSIGIGTINSTAITRNTRYYYPGGGSERRTEGQKEAAVGAGGGAEESEVGRSIQRGWMCRGAVGQPPVVLSAASTKNRALSQSVGSAPRSPLSVVHSVRLAYIHVYLNASNFIRWESMVISASSIYAIPSSSTNISIFGQFSDDGGAISIRIVGMCHRSVPTTLFDHCTVTKTFFPQFFSIET